MTPTIKSIVEKAGFLFCPSCEGSGEVTYFCGHDVTSDCAWCAGHGIIKSLNKQKHRKTCSICSGRGGLGCCDKRGFQEWESYELVNNAIL
jgi:hypothetical protein